MFFYSSRYIIWIVLFGYIGRSSCIKIYEKNAEFINFKKECSKTGTTEEALANAEKIGFKTDLFALHPLDKKIKLPIFVANFVLMDYGTGAIFGCPAHDQRDLDFANKYKLKIPIYVVFMSFFSLKCERQATIFRKL